MQRAERPFILQCSRWFPGPVHFGSGSCLQIKMCRSWEQSQNYAFVLDDGQRLLDQFKYLNNLDCPVFCHAYSQRESNGGNTSMLPTHRKRVTLFRPEVPDVRSCGGVDYYYSDSSFLFCSDYDLIYSMDPCSSGDSVSALCAEFKSIYYNHCSSKSFERGSWRITFFRLRMPAGPSGLVNFIYH